MTRLSRNPYKNARFAAMISDIFPSKAECDNWFNELPNESKINDAELTVLADMCDAGLWCETAAFNENEIKLLEYSALYFEALLIERFGGQKRVA